MEVIIEKDDRAASLAAARLIAGLVREKPDAVLGLATGGTPLGLYGELIRMHREESLDFGRVTSVARTKGVAADAKLIPPLKCGKGRPSFPSWVPGFLGSWVAHSLSSSPKP